MAKSTAAVACAMGVAVVFLVGSTAFTAGFRATTPPTGTGSQRPVGFGPALGEAGIGSSASSLSVGVVAGLAAAALAAVNRGAVARKAAETETAIAEKPDDAKLEKTEKKLYWPAGAGPWREPAPATLSQADQSAWFGTGGPSLGPIAEWNEDETVFAGGLVGSEYHGAGTYEWDPLGLSNRYPEHLPWYREAELKHGRVAMLGCVGLIAPDAFRIPLPQLEDPDLDMMTAHNKLIGPGLGEGPMWWLLLFCGVVESIRFKQLGLGFGDLTLENAGDLNFGKGFLPKSEDGQVQMKIKELKNGRLAMLAFSGAITQGILWETHHFPFVPTS